MEKAKIKSFTNLNAWKEAYALALWVYKITKQFLKEKIFVLASQMRRCKEEFSEIAEQTVKVSKLFNRLIESSQDYI